MVLEIFLVISKRHRLFKLTNNGSGGFDIILGDWHNPMQVLPLLVLSFGAVSLWCSFAALGSIIFFSCSLNCHIIAHYQPLTSSKLKWTTLSFPSWLVLAFLAPVALNCGELSGLVIFKGCGLPLTKPEGKGYGEGLVLFYFVGKMWLLSDWALNTYW